MDEYINSMYNEVIKNFKKENDVIFNSFIAYRRIIQRILDLQPKSIPGNNKDVFISLSSINAIVKSEINKLNKINENLIKKKDN